MALMNEWDVGGEAFTPISPNFCVVYIYQRLVVPLSYLPFPLLAEVTYCISGCLSFIFPFTVAIFGTEINMFVG